MKEDCDKGIRIILARHGETDWNRAQRFQGISDIPLNLNGHNQAKSLSIALQHENITAIYSSPLKRALETAQHIHKFHPSIDITEDSGFTEMNLGDFEGMTAQKWRNQYQDFRRRWMEHPALLTMPGGESLLDVQQRALSSLSNVCKHFQSGNTIVICSHNFAIVSLLCFAGGKTLDQFRDFKQDNAALNVIYKRDSNLNVEVVNDCRHLSM